MAEHYHTEGFILRQIPIGEKDLLLSIFTKDFGRIHGRVKSARSIESKMRFHTSTLAWVEVSLIKTRNDSWKIVGLNSKSNLLVLKNDKIFYKTISNIVALLGRMIIGEEPQEEIFYDVSDVYKTLVEAKKGASITDSETVLMIEIITVARILNHLGYMSKYFQEESVFEGKIDHHLISKVSPYKKQVIKAINEAFNASGL